MHLSDWIEWKKHWRKELIKKYAYTIRSLFFSLLDHYVKTGREHTDYYDEYAIKIRTLDDLLNAVEKVIEDQAVECKIQVKLAYVLKDILTGQHKLFYAGSNSVLFDTAMLIRYKSADKEKVLDHIKEMNWNEKLLIPGSSLTLVSLAYAKISVYRGSRPLC